MKGWPGTKGGLAGTKEASGHGNRAPPDYLDYTPNAIRASFITTHCLLFFFQPRLAEFYCRN
jgi:hypothetical protein